jgi:hypothetical protein
MHFNLFQLLPDFLRHVTTGLIVSCISTLCFFKCYFDLIWLSVHNTVFVGCWCTFLYFVTDIVSVINRRSLMIYFVTISNLQLLLVVYLSWIFIHIKSIFCFLAFFVLHFPKRGKPPRGSLYYNDIWQAARLLTEGHANCLYSSSSYGCTECCIVLVLFVVSDHS